MFDGLKQRGDISEVTAVYCLLYIAINFFKNLYESLLLFVCDTNGCQRFQTEFKEVSNLCGKVLTRTNDDT